jgi:hypothetical protein
MMHHKLHAKSYTANASPYTIDLSLMGAPLEAELKFEIADFDVEVVGNAAEVTMQGKGAFSTSATLDLIDGTFAIAGGKRKIEQFSLGALIFTSASTPFTVNIVRRIMV